MNSFEYLDNDFLPIGADAFAQEEIARPQTTYLKDVWRSFKKRKTAVFGLAVVCIMIVMVIFGPMMNEFNYYTNDYDHINQAPDAVHWFGTDELGRDLWTRVWVGGRVSLLIAVVATIIPYIIGMTVGGISGYIGGKVDMVIMRIVDILMGIPSMIYNILLMIVLGSGNISTLIIAFTITGWLGSARSTRGLVLQLKERDFVMASQTLGASPLRIIFKHLLPNTLGIAVVGMASSIPGIINLVAYGAAGATDAASAQPVAADILTAHPEIDIMMSETDSLCPGIFQECIQHGRVPGKDILIVCGADSADYTLEKIKSGEYLAVGNNAPYYTGEGIIQLIKDILDGKVDGNNLPATSYTPTYAVTPDNIDEVWDGQAAFAAMSDWQVQTIPEYNEANK